MQDEKSGMFPDSEDPELACVDGSLIDSDWNAGAPPDEIAEESLVRSGGENGTEGNPGPDGPKADQSFKLKYLGRELDVSRDELITLAQKGRDYDRIRSRADTLRDELKKSGDYKSFLDALANRTGQSREDFIDRTRSALSLCGEGAAGGRPAEAGAQPDPEGRPPKTDGGDAQKAGARRNREVAEFLSEYGTIDPRTIPKQVWEDVRAGKTLLAAYQSYEKKT
jgi:hypothetical protein